jgi:ABC-type glutathione transport system ATPase component
LTDIHSLESVLQVDGLTVRLPADADRRDAVSDIHFTLMRNEILCVVGESGSGKSVTASAVMRLLPDGGPRIAEGRILLDGIDLRAASEEAMRSLRGRRMGMIFQEPMSALNPMMRIGDQVAEVLEAHGVPAARRPAKVVELLGAVGLPDPSRIGQRHPHRLSGGQRQRVLIAMALALEPDILIADEPTTALDVTTQAQILQLIRDLQRSRGMGVLFITHDFGVVREIADRVVVMQKGRIVEMGSVRQVLDAPQMPYTRELLAAVPKFRTAARDDVSQAPVLLRVEGLGKSYRTRSLFGRNRVATKAVDGVSFSVRAGETVGLVGESGSGKSTVGRCIARILEPDEGAILVAETDIAHLDRAALKPWRRQIQMIFQDPFDSLNPRITVGRSIMAGPLVQGASPTEARRKMERLLERVGLSATVANRYPHEFSGGQRQRVGIARALAVDPQLLIADEAVSALDVSVQAQVLELLNSIQRELHIAILFITHDLRVASQMCHRILVMHRGSIVEQGLTEDIFARPQHPYTVCLMRAVPGADATLTAAQPGAFESAR